MSSGRTFLYELKKINRSKGTVLLDVSLLSLVLLGMIFSIFMNRENGYTIAEGYACFNGKDLKGDTYISELFQKDYEIYQEDIKAYPSYLQNIEAANEVSSIMDIFHQVSDFDQENRQKTIAAYKRLKDIKLAPSYFLGLSSWFYGSWQTYLFLAYVIGIGIIVFLRDSRQTRFFLNTTLAGRKQMYLLRLFAAVCKISFLYFISMGISLLITCMVTPKEAFHFSLQSIPGFFTSPWKLQIWAFILLWMVMKWLGLIIVLLILFLICGCLWSFADALLVFSVFLISQFGLFFRIEPNDYLAVLRYLNVFCLLRPEELLSSYQNINVFGYCINALTLWLLMLIFSFSVCLFAGNWLYRYHIPNEKWKGLSYYLDRYKIRYVERHKSLLWYQGKLFFIIARAFLCLTFYLLIIVYISYQERSFIDLNEFYYNQYADMLMDAKEGQENLLQTEEDRLFSQIEDEKADTSSLWGLYIRQEALYRVIEDFEYIHTFQKEGKKCTFLNQLPWRKVFGFRSGGQELFLFFMTLIFLLIPVVGSCIYEKRYPISQFFSFMPDMDKLYFGAYLVRSLYGFFIWGILLLKKLIPVLGKYHLQGFLEPARSLSFLPEAFYDLPIWLCFGSIELIKLLMIVVIANLPYKLFFVVSREE